MRDIKFRAWDIKNKILLIVQEMYHPHWIKGYTCYKADLFSRDYILQQYTGLKDKAGKEIYEGDIIKYNMWQDTKEHIMEIIIPDFYIEFFRYDELNDEYMNEKSIEIIGNLYENPELLTK